MNTNTLAPVFLDDLPVSLQDARPKVSAILAAVGKPDATQVKWLKSSTDTTGKSLRSEEVVDRTAEPGKPIYLASGAKGLGSGSAMPGKGWEKGAASTGQDPARQTRESGAAPASQDSARFKREGGEAAKTPDSPGSPKDDKAAGLQVKADSEARSAYGDSEFTGESRPDAPKAADEETKPSGDDEKSLSSG